MAGFLVAERHLRGDARRQVRHVEALNRADARSAFDEPFPDEFGSDSERSDETDARNDDSFHARALRRPSGRTAPPAGGTGSVVTYVLR